MTRVEDSVVDHIGAKVTVEWGNKAVILVLLAGNLFLNSFGSLYGLFSRHKSGLLGISNSLDITVPVKFFSELFS